MNNMFIPWALFLLAIFPSRALPEPSTIFISNEYSFDYAMNPSAPEIANSLCGTRCSSISGSLNSYMMPGGWRLVKTGFDKKIIVDIDSPFLEGKCICVGDEYKVTRDIPLPDSPKNQAY